MALPVNEPLKIYQGEDWDFTVVWHEDDGTPRDLTGCTARMQVRRGADAEDVLIELTTANGRISLGGGQGFMVLELSASETAAMLSSSMEYPFQYDLEVIDPDGKVTKVMRGPFANIREVTR